MITFTDSKVQELVSKAGMEGYGAYCVIVDCLVDKGRSTFDAGDIKGFAWLMHMDENHLKGLVDAMTSCQLFVLGRDKTERTVGDAADDLKAAEARKQRMAEMGRKSGEARRKGALK